MNNIISEVLLEQDPRIGLSRMLDILSNNGTFTQPSVYFLSVLDNCYKKIAGVSRENTLSIDFNTKSHTIVNSERDECILAFVIGEVFDDVQYEDKRLISGILLHFYDQYFYTNYFKEIRRPIDFTNPAAYYEETAELLSSALGMPMVAIRRLNSDDDLESLCFYDTEKPPSQGEGFLASEMPLPFMKLLKKTEKLLEENKLEEIRPAYHCNIDAHDPQYAFLNRSSTLKLVKTFVIFPVVYGHDLFGIMSCASRCRYVFSDIQKHAVGGLMQIIGVAISNFLRYHEAQELHLFRTEQIIDTTAVEVAKSTKHELINAQAEVSTMLLGLKRAVNTNQSKKIQPALRKLEAAVDNLLPSIQKLSFGDKADKELDETSIKAIWNRVIILFSERLKRMGIEPNYQGPDCNGLYHSEMLQNAFLNLILNSIDAFKTQKKRGRKISIVTSIVSAGTKCQIDYSDNAGGLNQIKSSYRIPDLLPKTHPDMPLKELIFLPKVSSKGGLGSGWGLYLVRRAISMHKGSINLVDHKNGCTFRIDMPCNQTKQ